MTIEETKRLLENCLTYVVKSKSLRNELQKTSDKELKKSISKELKDLTDQVMSVRSKIESLDGMNVKLVMRLRYVNLMRFIDIAKEMKITYVWVHKLHADGVEQLSKIL